MKIAVVHGVLRGGAARRLGGTLGALADQSGVVQKEYVFGEGSSLYPGDSFRVNWSPDAPLHNRIVRPLWRYRDLVSMRSAWAGLWEEVNAWQPEVIFVNPCALPGGAPPRLIDARSVSLYYCDEPRRVDYEKAAAQASNPVTRLPYLPMRRVHRADERESVRAATALVTNSDYTAQRIAAAYDRSAEVVTPGIAEIFNCTGGLSEASTHLLSVGTLIPSKGHDLVIEAASLAEVGLPVVVVAPRVDDEESARLREIAERLGVELKIEVGISDERLFDLYRDALVTLYLARDEPLGLVSLESQACGTPVVVAAEGGLPETLDDQVTGFSVRRDAKSAAAALTQLLDTGRRQQMGAAAAARPVPRDSTSAERILTLLGDLAAG